MTESPSLLSRLLPALVNGVKLLVTGIAALVMAIIAAVSTIVGVVAKVMAEVLAQVAGFVRDALPFSQHCAGTDPGCAGTGDGCQHGCRLSVPNGTVCANDTGSVIVGGVIAAGLVQRLSHGLRCLANGPALPVPLLAHGQCGSKAHLGRVPEHS